MWILNKNAQYRIMHQDISEEIRLTFWIPDGTMKHFTTSYTNLIKMLDSADKSLYDPSP